MNIIYKLGLCDGPFRNIKYGTKVIEMRLNDEKRSKVEIGDYFLFTNETTNEQLKVKIIDIFKYQNFEELYARHDKTLLGYRPDEVASADDMLIYYTKERIEKYGVIGFKIEKV